jgi:hypothetical protein
VYLQLKMQKGEVERGLIYWRNLMGIKESERRGREVNSKNSLIRSLSF